MKQHILPLMTAFALSVGAISAVQAQPAPPPGAPPGGMPPGGMPPGGKPPMSMAKADQNPLAAPAGNYTIDLDHCAVIARVPHAGVSISVLRFGVTSGTLQWNPAQPGSMKLDVTVNAVPFTAPIEYKIKPESILNTAKFPQARFVSTSVKKTGAKTADVDGQLTFMGVTKPAVIHASLVGIAKSPMTGGQTMGFTGTMEIKWTDFAAPAGPFDQVTVMLDAEFDKS